MNRPAHRVKRTHTGQRVRAAWSVLSARSQAREPGAGPTVAYTVAYLLLGVVHAAWLVVSLLWWLLITADAVIMVTPTLFKSKGKHKPVVVSDGDGWVATLDLSDTGLIWNTSHETSVEHIASH